MSWNRHERGDARGDVVPAEDARIERAFTRAFAREVGDVPAEGDAARIDAAIAATLAARATRTAGARVTSLRARTKAALVFAAAAAVLAASAYASVHRRGGEPSDAPAVVDQARGRPAPPPASPASPRIVPQVSSAQEKAPPSVGVPRPLRPSSSLPLPRQGAPAPTPAELFARANEARRAGDVDRAIALYVDLERAYPGSREASTARVSHGRLLLDRPGDADGAAALFDAYVGASPDGTLAEEARLGRALARMRQGDGAGERAAWEDLLRAHPMSVHAPRARARLQVLAP